MITERLLIIDGEISATSKRCFSCAHFSSEKSVRGMVRYCSGYVIRVGVSDKGFCDLKRKDVSRNERCSHWKLDKKFRAFVR